MTEIKNQDTITIRKGSFLWNLWRWVTYNTLTTYSRIISIPSAFIAWSSEEKSFPLKIVDGLLYGIDIPSLLTSIKTKTSLILELLPTLAKDPSSLTLNQTKRVVEELIPNLRPIAQTGVNILWENWLQYWISTFTVFLLYAFILPFILKGAIYEERPTLEHKVRIRLNKSISG